MFTQFRKYYPQGSLISELVTINHGKYIVRTLVQIEGVTLATGLAAAETVEQAEDRSRDRALTILDLNSLSQSITNIQVETVVHPLVNQSVANTDNKPSSPTLNQHESISIPQPQPTLNQHQSNNDHESNTEPTVNEPEFNAVSQPLPTVNDPEFNSVSQSLPTVNDPEFNSVSQPLPTVNDPEFNSVSQPLPTVNDPEFNSVSQPLPTVNDPEFNSVSQPLPTVNDPEFNSVSQPLPTVEENYFFDEEFTQEPLETVAPEEKKSQLPLAEEEIYLELEQSEITPESPNQPDLNSQAPMDFSEVIAKTDIELKRLQWTQEKGRDYLLQTYGKKSRHYLSDEELLEFLNFLTSQPTP